MFNILVKFIMVSLWTTLLIIGKNAININNISNTEKADTTVFLSGVTRYRNIIYADNGLPRDTYRHYLDLYIPSDEKWVSGKPLVIWIHGGGWQIGYKDDFNGLYGKIGSILAHKGIAFANINYRLTPRVKHPGHIRDCAQAFVWLYQHASDYGYNINNIFVSGHSAGAHLAALLASDEQWLNEYNLEAGSVIAGVIPVSGIYNLKDMKQWFLPEDGDEFIPVSVLDKIEYTIRDRIPMGRGLINPFTDEDLLAASPVNCVDGDEPPFLLIHESASPNDFMRNQAEQMAKALDDAGVENQMLELKNENHLSMLVDMLRPNNPAIVRMIDFINLHVDDTETANDK